ncbi:transglycosylase SLT domain-containing protein [Actinobacillus equuli]|uniref:transglycosylase SLT domain-containing protein n=1 Tax=Actinobacillus equuli TaxID=718 RepID=UPI002442313A|nr:transglycosylase SLT domain-containing protein [Actinobacillus equuli]WGE66067.1 transglycosylase SLT domain-containing protein [Actinobacillus equuli subsp. equuli]WGE79997.1 transglycosylase SLT domain-containing protein [Actinobacillus equuli subsp. equuli]
MWKKTFVALLVVASVNISVAAKPKTKVYSEAEVAQLQAELEKKLTDKWQIEQQTAETLAKQRAYFEQLEVILKVAQTKKQLTPDALALSHKLINALAGYPLEMEAEWELLKTKLAMKQVTEQEIASFAQKYPNSPYQRRLDQLPFEQLYQAAKWTELLEYAKKVTPEGNENQCRVFSAQYQLFASQAQINPEAEQAVQSTVSANAVKSVMTDLLGQFEKFWLKTVELPQSCADIEAYWRDQGGKTAEKIRLKAVELFKQNAPKGLEILSLNIQDSELALWLSEVSKLQNNVSHLQNFIQNQPLTEHNKALVMFTFPKLLKSLAEDIPSPNFAPYQTWAEKWQLTPAELKEWKTAFISHFFDNQSGEWQIWRDNELQTLKADNLTERRLRMALWKKEKLETWLTLLSDEAKQKTEWRYWLAKTEKDSQKSAQQFADLAKERGFYPMLAAQQLAKVYQFEQPAVKSLTAEQIAEFTPQFMRIKEWRALNRFESAKGLWTEWLKGLSFEEQLGLSEYAKQQDWYDLAVEATIQAKAWDYIDLRLPNAYTQWFDLNLTEKSVSRTFAMAIARQESAWSSQAKSHANAMGLMQMLPSTAALTAKNMGLPFENDKDLFDPLRNIMLATAHLNELNVKYPNNRILIAAAYNAGASRVDKWLARSNGTLTMDEFIASIPFYETRGYVQNVLTYDYYYQMLQGVHTKQMFYKEELQKQY